MGNFSCVKIFKYNYLVSFIFMLLPILQACDHGENPPDECDFNQRLTCGGTSWSFVDPNTYESLLGYDRAIHPDSIVITNTRGDIMYHDYFFTSGDWVFLSDFSPFHEITCFNQCISDSAFTRTYYMYIGNGDTDTVEAYFAPQSEKYHLFFNGVDGAVPDDLPEGQTRKSNFWFLKKI